MSEINLSKLLFLLIGLINGVSIYLIEFSSPIDCIDSGIMIYGDESLNTFLADVYTNIRITILLNGKIQENIYLQLRQLAKLLIEILI